MPENTHITEALDYYLDKNNPSHHALMLTGKWGSGKTHFITEYIQSWLEKNPAPDDSDYNPACYVSLYGIRTAQEL